jgi:hypothetical protein
MSRNGNECPNVAALEVVPMTERRRFSAEETVKKRILAIYDVRDRISFIQGDGFDVIREHSSCSDVVFLLIPLTQKVAGRPGADSTLTTRYRIRNFSSLRQVVRARFS